MHVILENKVRNTRLSQADIRLVEQSQTTFQYSDNLTVLAHQTSGKFDDTDEEA